MTFRLLKLLLSLWVVCIDEVSAAYRYLLGRQIATKCVVLYYHAIRVEARQQFASQMDELARLSVPIDIGSQEPLPKGVRYSAVTFDDGFLSVVDNALPELRVRMIPCTIFVPTGSIGCRPSWIGGSHEDAAEVVLSADVMRAVASEPLVRIASHSVSHPDFSRLDDEQAKDEFHMSKSMIEEITGREVASFSFPHGAHTEESLDLAAQCGYARVFTIDPVQLADPRKGFVVGRVRVEPDDWPIEFRLKVLGAYRWMVRVSKAKRNLFRMMGKGEMQTRRPQRGF